MGLSIYLGHYDLNVTHNVGRLLTEAFGVGQHWDDFVDGKNGLFLTAYVERALHRIKRNPAHYDKFSASNGWGTREQMIDYLEKWLKACRECPEENAEVNYALIQGNFKVIPR